MNIRTLFARYFPIYLRWCPNLEGSQWLTGAWRTQHLRGYTWYIFNSMIITVKVPLL